MPDVSESRVFCVRLRELCLIPVSYLRRDLPTDGGWVSGFRLRRKSVRGNSRDYSQVGQEPITITFS